MKALCFTVLFATSVHAQNNKAVVAEPQGVMTEQDRAKKAVDDLKAYTDRFKISADEAFPAPPPIPIFSAKAVDARNFFNQTPFGDYKQCTSDYRNLFEWWEGLESGEPYRNPKCFAKSVHLDPERFQIAYAGASNKGTDKEAGARWVCGLAEAMRNYFNFYNSLQSGDKGTWIATNLWGVGVGPVQAMQLQNDWISARFKEAAQVDLGVGENKNVLNYATVERCKAAASEEIAKQTPKEPQKTKIPTLMNDKTKEQVYLKEDLSDIDMKNDYWVLYYDASWQPWSYVAANEKRWKNTAESLKQFINCRYPTWVGNFIATAPKNAKYELRYYPKGGTVLRHPKQPNSAKERDAALVKANSKKYCR